MALTLVPRTPARRSPNGRLGIEYDPELPIGRARPSKAPQAVSGMRARTRGRPPPSRLTRGSTSRKLPDRVHASRAAGPASAASRGRAAQSSASTTGRGRPVSSSISRVAQRPKRSSTSTGSGGRRLAGRRRPPAPRPGSARRAASRRRRGARRPRRRRRRRESDPLHPLGHLRLALLLRLGGEVADLLELGAEGLGDGVRAQVDLEAGDVDPGRARLARSAPRGGRAARSHISPSRSRRR